MATIAFLGTGLLGSGFVHSLLARGHDVVVWNRTPAKAAPLVEAGARLAKTAAEAVHGVERVHLCLSSDDAVDGVLAGIVGAVAAGVPVVDHSTTSAEGASARHARLAAQGLPFVHAPVFMGPAAARSAKGMMMAGGPAETFALVEEHLKTMTGDLWYVGPELGRAAALKLLGNAMLIVIAAGLADTFTLGTALGVPLDDAHGLLARLKPGGAIDVRGKKMASGDFTASFELTMARKDVGLMIAAAAGRPLATLPGIARRADDLIAAGHGADDLGVLAIDALPKK